VLDVAGGNERGMCALVAEKLLFNYLRDKGMISSKGFHAAMKLSNSHFVLQMRIIHAD